MSMTHRLFVLIVLVSTSAVIATTSEALNTTTSMTTNYNSTGSIALSPRQIEEVSSTTNITTIHTQTSTEGMTTNSNFITKSTNPSHFTTSTNNVISTVIGGPTSIPSWSTATVFPSNVTTPVIPTHGGNVTSIPFSTQSNVTSSSTISPENATISSVSTPGNASIPPLTTSGHATPTPTTVTTAANTSSPPVSTPGNVTNHPVTAPGTATNPPVNTGSATTSFPVPVNSTTSFLTTRGNTTSPPFSTLGNTTATISTPGSATTAPQITGGNSTITAGNATTTPSNATTAPITTLSNGTFPPLTTHVSILTTLGNATVPPVTTTGNSTMSALTTPGNFTAPPQPSQATCPAVPCSPLSVCVNSTCQCLAGTYLLNNSCVETKTFPSTLRVNRTFENAMKNPQSHEFRQTANEIISAVNIALHNQPNYISSTVLRLMPGSVVASVNSFFELNSQATQDSVIAAMDTAIKECKDCGILANATYMKTDLCQQEPSPCDLDTTECAFREGLAECPCKMGHVPSPYQRKSCTVCPSGKKAQGEKCVPCPFGYSGFNCDDSTLIALVVVACVLGGVLLIVILAVLIYLCVTHRWKKSKEHVYNTPNPAEEFTSTWSSPGIISIPRATVSASNDANDTTLEMTEGAGKRNSHSNGLAGSYDLATDGLRTFKGEYPSRYSYLVGHENPYFLAEDKKRTT
ncbi:protein HEG homolog 1-like isoform X3 [Xyrauchen texanus]|uniref:protein HEG homolog 1-like isoform X3 n=1 Tax=Xyrauchen texanus TaxID=154827 RepID=UPI002241AA13|nr:protein HEG homolog 1-like isoform X3 [Xyrauchen texanus]